jgi:hypothetical protein
MLALLIAMTLAQPRPVKVQQDGVTLGQGWIGTINCSGTGIACTRNAATGVATVEVTGGSGGGGLSDGGGVGADVPVVTYSASSELTAERVLSAGQYTAIDIATAGQAQIDWVHGLTCSSGQALTSSGTTAMACTSTLTASDVACAGTCVADSEIAAVSGSKVSKVAQAYAADASITTQALDHDPTACGAGEYVTDISAAGVLTCATPAGGGSANYASGSLVFDGGYDMTANVTAAWATGSSSIICGPMGEEASVEGLNVTPLVLSSGSFTVRGEPRTGKHAGSLSFVCTGL